MERAYGVGVGCEGEEPVDGDAVEGVVWRHIDEKLVEYRCWFFEVQSANCKLWDNVLVLYVNGLFRQLLGVLACGAAGMVWPLLPSGAPNYRYDAVGVAGDRHCWRVTALGRFAGM